MDYQGKGSGAGVRTSSNRTVDFAASDAAMTDEQIAKVPGGVQLLPMTAGEIVIGYNLPGGPEGAEADPRRLSRDLPRQDHQVERPEAEGGESRRSLCPTSTSRWCGARTRVAPRSCSPRTSPRSARSGARGREPGTTVNWPKSDKFVASPKNDGVTATIKQTPGAIGYIEFAFAEVRQDRDGAAPEPRGPVRQSRR